MGSGCKPLAHSCLTGWKPILLRRTEACRHSAIRWPEKIVQESHGIRSSTNLHKLDAAADSGHIRCVCVCSMIARKMMLRCLTFYSREDVKKCVPLKSCWGIYVISKKRKTKKQVYFFQPANSAAQEMIIRT